jgi:hypothetical protein
MVHRQRGRKKMNADRRKVIRDSWRLIGNTVGLNKAIIDSFVAGKATLDTIVI